MEGREKIKGKCWKLTIEYATLIYEHCLQTVCLIITNFGEVGFGVTVADILSAPFTPAYAFPGASMRRNFSSKAFALEFFTERSGSNPPINKYVKDFFNLN